MCTVPEYGRSVLLVIKIIDVDLPPMVKKDLWNETSDSWI